jgi:hypothetical protein
MTNYCQYSAAGLTLLKQFDVQPWRTFLGRNCGFYEGPYV